MKIIDFIEQEELYQDFKSHVNPMTLEDQEHFLDMFKGLSRLTKKQINMFGGFTIRYQQERQEAGSKCLYDDVISPQEESIIYSVLEKLADKNGISIRRAKLMGNMANYNLDNKVITLNTELTGKEQNMALANRLGFAEIKVDGYYDDPKEYLDKDNIVRVHKQTRNIADMLIDGIKMALLAGN